MTTHQANRFAVWRAYNRLELESQDVPSLEEIAKVVGISVHAARGYLMGLGLDWRNEPAIRDLYDIFSEDD